MENHRFFEGSRFSDKAASSSLLLGYMLFLDVFGSLLVEDSACFHDASCQKNPYFWRGQSSYFAWQGIHTPMK